MDLVGLFQSLFTYFNDNVEIVSVELLTHIAHHTVHMLRFKLILCIPEAVSLNIHRYLSRGGICLRKYNA